MTDDDVAEDPLAAQARDLVDALVAALGVAGAAAQLEAAARDLRAVAAAVAGKRRATLRLGSR